MVIRLGTVGAALIEVTYWLYHVFSKISNSPLHVHKGSRYSLIFVLARLSEPVRLVRPWPYHFLSLRLGKIDIDPEFMI